MSDGNEIGATGAIVLATFLLAILVGPWFMVLSDREWKGRWIKTGAATHVVLVVTLWLWGPWLYYGISTLYRWNIGKVNDLSKPEVVKPPTDVVRPSLAEPKP